MGRPSRKILDLRKAAIREFAGCPLDSDGNFAIEGDIRDTLATILAAEFGVPYEVALTQVRYVHYQLTHDGRRPHRGQQPDTTAHLGPERCAWLRNHGGKAQNIKRLIDEAMAKQ